MEKEISTIQTTKGELRYYRDWEQSEGGIVMLNAKTIKRYMEIQDVHPKCEDYGVFFAFNNEQLEKGIAHLKELGVIKDVSELQRAKNGLFGTHNSITKFLDFYTERDKAIPKECDPQEVYFYEYNNFESMYTWDGDEEAIKVIIGYWGVDVARKIIRYNSVKTIEQLVKDK